MDLKQFYINNKSQVHFWGAVVASLCVLYIISKKFIFSTFDDFYKLIKKSEGGFVNDKDDNGLATYKGISSRFNPEYADKIKNKTLTDSEAKSIFKRKYYDTMKIAYINNARLRYQMADHSINAGVKTSTRMLQQTIGTKQTGNITNDDIKKVNLADESKVPIVDRYKQLRRDYYNAIVRKNPTKSKFLKSWMRRVDSDKELFKN